MKLVSKTTEERCLRCMEAMGEESVCPFCGSEPQEVYDIQYARPGTVVGGRYLLGHYVRKNGEGALYAGFDSVQKEKVWVREYFPQTMAQRDIHTGRVSPLSGCGAQYKALMSDFVDICNEVRRLSVTEQVVPLENVVSENNTVYSVYRGLNLISFEQYLEEQGGRISFRQAYSLLLPICNALELLHSHGQVHRGVSPYTIHLGSNGKLYLWDFALGATRTVGSELDCELFSGYTAPEQYSPNGWQGSWSDVYAMGALFYRAITGVVPPKSIRIDNEQNQLARIEELLSGIAPNISEAVRESMQPSAEERVQTIQTLISKMIQKRSSGTAVYNTSRVQREGGRDMSSRPSPRHAGGGSRLPEQGRPTRRRRRPRGRGTAKFVVLGTVVMLMVLGGIFYYVYTTTISELIGSEQEQNGAGSSLLPDDMDTGGQAVELAAVPEFVGRSLADFRNDPYYQERFVFTTHYERRPEFAGGTVYQQIPASGTMLAAAEPINVALWVSTDNLPMPSVIGLTLEQATLVLGEHGFSNIQSFSQISSQEPGTILTTVPQAGVMISTSDGIGLIIATEPPPPPPPPEPEVDEQQPTDDTPGATLDLPTWQGNETGAGQGEQWWTDLSPDEFSELGLVLDPATGQWVLPGI